MKDTIAQSDYVICFGAMLAYDNEEAKEAIVEAIAKKDAEFIYMHPMDDMELKVYYSQFIKYEVGSEEGIATMLVDAFVKSSNDRIQSFIDELDIGYISAESSAGEEEFEQAVEKAQDKTQKTLIVGDDIFTHERSNSIVKLLCVLKKYTQFNVVVLNEKYAPLLDECSDESLEEVDDLPSYNGTLIYRHAGEHTDALIGSESFSRVAKVNHGDEVFIQSNGSSIQRLFKVDKNLQGTIALCAINESNTHALFEGYRYKQVKIERVDT
jgi:NADH-quinone oxidoreductase subunit F